MKCVRNMGDISQIPEGLVYYYVEENPLPYCSACHAPQIIGERKPCRYCGCNGQSWKSDDGWLVEPDWIGLAG